MLKHIIAVALQFRFYVVLGTLALSLYGLQVAYHMPVDVFPDLDRPYVTMLIDAHGYAPEEIERLICFPVESAMNGAPGVSRVRSSTGVGLTIITVEFEWGMNIYLCRQIVQERLQVAQGRLPQGITPMLAPVASVTGEVMRLGLQSNGALSPIELLTLANWEVRQRLLTVAGVAQVTTIGGGAKQYQIIADPTLMAKYNIAVEDLEVALHGANENTPGGFVFDQGQEVLVRNIGRPEHISELEKLVVKVGPHGSIRLQDVAKIQEDRAIPRGSAGINGEEAVILTVFKQPGANSLELTRRLEEAITGIRNALPNGVILQENLYQQAIFIKLAIGNVVQALRDGAAMVVVVLILFLMNVRMSFIILTAIPLSFLITAIAFHFMGLTVNTMTLGGLAVAVGELVDAAIVGAENTYRRLRENLAKPRAERRLFLPLIAHATEEVCSAIVLGTMIVLLVVIPLFALPGIMGRLFGPIGTAYLISNFASMVVAIIVTPVLCSLLLHGKLPEFGRDTYLVRVLKRAIEPVVMGSIRKPALVLTLAGIACAWALGQAVHLGRDLLPEFDEGTAVVIAMSPQGINLEESNRFGRAVELTMRQVPEVAASKTGRETGMAEGDVHASGVNTSHVTTQFVTPPGQHQRPRAEILADLRAALAPIPGVVCEVEQPIQHRISVIISGARTQISVRIFGPDLKELIRLGDEVHAVIKTVPGVVDDSVEQQRMVPQLRIVPKKAELARYGLSMEHVMRTMEIALQGHELSQVLEGERCFDLVLRGTDDLRHEPERIPDILLSTPSGGKVPLKAVAEVSRVMGPSMINHENSRRRIMVMCNIAGRDLGSAVREMNEKISTRVKLPPGYSFEIGGQYQQLVESSHVMLLLSIFALVLMTALLLGEFRSLGLVAMILCNIPLALIGSVLAVMIAGDNLNMGSLVGFIALCGIASRNGILLISHFITLVRDDGEGFTPEMILRGCKERLTPVLMTALTASLGLLPLVLSKGEPGKEILYPVALVIFGGLFTSTILDYTVTPAAVWLFGRKAILKQALRPASRMDDEHMLEDESLELEGPLAGKAG